MENSSILLRLFVEFVGKDLDIENLEDKIIMQKIVFLLGELGLKIGNYKFSLNKFGPFSQSLHNDIALISKDDTPFLGTFAKPVVDTISFLKNLLAMQPQTKYSLREWIEAIASFLFLKKYMYPSYNWNCINEKIIDLKKHLLDRPSNEKAILCCEELLNYNIQ